MLEQDTNPYAVLPSSQRLGYREPPEAPPPAPGTSGGQPPPLPSVVEQAALVAAACSMLKPAGVDPLQHQARTRTNRYGRVRPGPRQVAAPGLMIGPLGVPPEMHKERHCIVISTTIGLTTIVPLSTKAPTRLRAFHHRIPAGKYPGMSVVDASWTKSDLLTTVSNSRVDRVLVAGRRTTVILDPADLRAVRATVLHALQLGRLTPVL